jgi:heptose I phosphotransferase
MHQLTDDGIATIQPIAFGEDIRSRREARSAILTAEVPGESLERLAANWSRDVHLPAIRRILVGTADLVARLHGCGYIHRDLYLSHIFFDEAAAPEEALRLIDLQRVIRPRWRRGRWVVKDLASLNYSTPFDLVTTADRLRWLCRYLNVDRFDGRARRLVRRIMTKTARIARHDRQRRARWQAEGTAR